VIPFAPPEHDYKELAGGAASFPSIMILDFRRPLARHRFGRGLVSVSFVLASISCGDPVRDDAIAALGPEAPNVPRGPLHRPGQPCLLCHQDGGRAQPFSLAGTVYVDAHTQVPDGGVLVIVLDSNRQTFTGTTNCVGTFFVRPNEFSPAYPIWISLVAGSVRRDMDSASYREGACAACHVDPAGPASTGHVYLIDDPTLETAPPPTRCN
jgi:hypothetical protein